MALVTTVGGSTSDSYVSLAEADSYFAADSHFLASTWAALSDTQQEAALRTAARQMERVQYFGKKANESQALSWPRVYRSLWFSDTIPKAIKQAQMEQALHLARNSSQIGSATPPSQGVSQVTIGDFSVTYGSQQGQANLAPVNLFAPEAQTLLKGYWTQGGVVFAGDRESAAAYDLSSNPMDGQREYDND